jgi:hypothetical protein
MQERGRYPTITPIVTTCFLKRHHLAASRPVS